MGSIYYMSSKAVVALFIVFNLVFFTCVSSTRVTCSKDALELGVCGNLLGLVPEAIGTKPSKECCTLIKGLADLEVAVCLCTAIKASVLEVVKVNQPIDLTILVNKCGNKVPGRLVCT